MMQIMHETILMTKNRNHLLKKLALNSDRSDTNMGIEYDIKARPRTKHNDISYEKD